MDSDVKNKRKFLYFILIASFFWGTSFPVISYGLRFISPDQLLFLRFFSASLIALFLFPSSFRKIFTHPSLILVGNSDPIVKIEHSFEAYDKLPYPIWLELDAPDHLLLESNIDNLSKLIPKFANDPWEFYEENKHLKPKRG